MLLVLLLIDPFEPSSDFSIRSTHTSRPDITIHLDKGKIEAILPGWKQMTVNVEIEFLKRDLSIFGRIGPAHWAFLLKCTMFFCTIEYGKQGIIIKFYKRERGIKYASAGILGGMDHVYYNDNLRTYMNFAQILGRVNSMKKNWRANNFDTVSHNCQHFIKILGRRLIYNFGSVRSSDFRKRIC